MTPDPDEATLPAAEQDLFLGGDRGPSTSTGPFPIEWRDLDDDETAEQLNHLAEWVQWLVSRYALDHRTVPECWAQHPALIEELAALHSARTWAYDPHAHGSEPLLWHERLAEARSRLADHVARIACRPGAHRPSGTSCAAPCAGSGGASPCVAPHLDARA